MSAPHQAGIEELRSDTSLSLYHSLMAAVREFDKERMKTSSQGRLQSETTEDAPSSLGTTLAQELPHTSSFVHKNYHTRHRLCLRHTLNVPPFTAMVIELALGRIRDHTELVSGGASSTSALFFHAKLSSSLLLIFCSRTTMTRTHG
jgi:hypothetical protein